MLTKKLLLSIIVITQLIVSAIVNAGTTISDPTPGGTNQFNDNGDIYGFENVGDSITWYVTADIAETYQLTFTYFSPWGNKRNSLYINDQKATIIEFPGSAGQAYLGTWHQLNSGVNKIELRRDADDWGYITIVDLTIPPLKDSPIKIEAEDAELSGGAEVVYNEKQSGDYVVRFNETDAEITWEFDIYNPGEYTIQFNYLAPYGSKKQKLIIDGNEQTLEFPKQDRFFSPLFMDVFFTTGHHTITLKKDWGHISVDYFKIGF